MQRSSQWVVLSVLAPLFLSQPSLRAQNDYGGNVITENQNFDQSTAAVPAADPTNPEQFYANVYAGTTGTILTSSTLTPPSGKTGTVTFTQNGASLSYNQYFTTQTAMDAAFGAGTYALTVNTSTPNTYHYSPALGTDDLASIAIPQIANTSWAGGSLYINPTTLNTITWNTPTVGVSFSIFNTPVSVNSSSAITSATIQAGTLSANTAYTAILQFGDSSGNYQRSTHFTIGINDLGNYSVFKITQYDQSSASSPTLDPREPYQLNSSINNGSNGTVLSSSSVIPPASSTGTVSFQAQGTNGLFFEQNFTSAATLDAAYDSGTYYLTIQTATPNTYTPQLSLGADNFPAIPQVTSATNATWINGILTVTNISLPVTLTWNDPGNMQSYFQLGNSSLNSTGTSITDTYTIPASFLQSNNNNIYEGSVILTNVSASNSSIPNAIGTSGFLTEVQFAFQIGTPAAPSQYLYSVEKEHVLFQTSNSAPVNGSGDFPNYDPAPYNINFQAPVTGTVTGPSSTNYPLLSNGSSSKYRYLSGAYTSQANLDSASPDGTYAFPGSGGSVSLTGDLYPAAAQVTQVNGATPVWDAQGQLALDPAATNTLTWAAVTVPNFSTDGHQTVQFEASGGSLNLKEQAGVTTGVTTPYTTLVIPAGDMTATQTYAGTINYGQASAFTTISSNTFAAALYATENSFTAIALKPQTISFPTIQPQVANGSLALSATTNSSLAIIYTVISGPASLSGNTLTFTGTGTVTIKASQAGNGTYASASNVLQSFTVNPAPAGTDTPTMPQWALVAFALLLATAGWKLLPKPALEK